MCKLLLYCHLNQASVLYAMFPLTLFLQKKPCPSPFVCFFCFSNSRPSRCQTFPCVSSDLACYLFQKITPTDQMAIGLPCPSYSSLDPQVPHVQTLKFPMSKHLTPISNNNFKIKHKNDSEYVNKVNTGKGFGHCPVSRNSICPAGQSHLQAGL